jgi:hypothetical protein
MSCLSKKNVVVTDHIHNLRGGSQPILARASDGMLYVVKFANNPQGANLLLNEAVGSELYRQFKLAVPEWQPVMVTDDFLDRNPQCWMQTVEGPLRPQAGWCFGSRFLGGKGERLLEILPGSSMCRVVNQSSFWMAWLIDICAGHVDNRQAIFRQAPSGALQAFFVDHGHLLGGPKGELSLPIQASRYLDPRIYPSVSSDYLENLQRSARCLDANQFWQWTKTLPDSWKTASALDALEQCMGRLASTAVLQGTIDAMAQSLRQGHRFEQSRRQEGRELPLSVLRAGVQTARLGQGRVVECSSHLACA